MRDVRKVQNTNHSIYKNDVDIYVNNKAKLCYTIDFYKPQSYDKCLLHFLHYAI